MTGSHSVAIVVVSDRAHRGERPDESAPALTSLLEDAGLSVAVTRVLPDEQVEIEMELMRLCDEESVPLVLTTGGTGFSPRDVTPEATRAVIHREAPGLAEEGRRGTLSRTRFAVLSRGVAGIRGRSLIVNLPGSPKGAREMLEAILPVLPHALSVLVESSQEHPGE